MITINASVDRNNDNVRKLNLLENVQASDGSTCSTNSFGTPHVMAQTFNNSYVRVLLH